MRCSVIFILILFAVVSACTGGEEVVFVFGDDGRAIVTLTDPLWPVVSVETGSGIERLDYKDAELSGAVADGAKELGDEFPHDRLQRARNLAIVRMAYNLGGRAALLKLARQNEPPYSVEVRLGQHVIVFEADRDAIDLIRENRFLSHEISRSIKPRLNGRIEVSRTYSGPVIDAGAFLAGRFDVDMLKRRMLAAGVERMIFLGPLTPTEDTASGALAELCRAQPEKFLRAATGNQRIDAAGRLDNCDTFARNLNPGKFAGLRVLVRDPAFTGTIGFEELSAMIEAYRTAGTGDVFSLFVVADGREKKLVGPARRDSWDDDPMPSVAPVIKIAASYPENVLIWVNAGSVPPPLVEKVVEKYENVGCTLSRPPFGMGAAMRTAWSTVLRKYPLNFIYASGSGATHDDEQALLRYPLEVELFRMWLYDLYPQLSPGDRYKGDERAIAQEWIAYKKALAFFFGEKPEKN